MLGGLTRNGLASHMGGEGENKNNTSSCFMLLKLEISASRISYLAFNRLLLPLALMGVLPQEF